MTPRDEIAAAASSVEGVTVDPVPRQLTGVGRGFVALARSERDDSGLGFMDWWDVTIVLPTDLGAAELWIEFNRDALCTALEAEIIVTTITPVQLLLDEATVNAVTITGPRAH